MWIRLSKKLNQQTLWTWWYILITVKLTQSLKNIRKFQIWNGQSTHLWHLQWLWSSILQIRIRTFEKCKKMQTFKRTTTLRQKKRRLWWLKTKMSIRKTHSIKLIKKSKKFQKKITLHTRQFVMTTFRTKLTKESRKYTRHQIHLSLTLTLRVKQYVTKLIQPLMRFRWVYKLSRKSWTLILTSKEKKST